MSKPRETFNKKEREKKKQQAKADKQDRKQERKSMMQKGRPLHEMMAYVDQNGNLSSVPPDPKLFKAVKAEDMNTGVPVRQEEETERSGIVNYFNDEKGYGFIRDQATGKDIFVHANQVMGTIRKNDNVSFQMERTLKGLNAVEVKKTQ